MKRFPRFVSLFVSVAAGSLLPAARADVAYERIKDGNREIEVVRMTVTPAAEPVPAFRHRLLAREVDLKTGNAVPFYYRALAEMRPAMKTIRDKFDKDGEFSSWYSTGDTSTPIAKLPLEKVREADQMFDPIYRHHLLPAFERSDCDWGLGVRELRGIDVVNFLLPEFQDSRELARLMGLRTRLAIAERRYDDAIAVMENQYRLGHDVATVPFLVCGLIGIAIDSMNNGIMLDLIANPGTPNMYWALTELPQPLVDLQPAARFEMDFGPRMFPFIDAAETAEHAPEEWNRLFTSAVRDFAKISGELVSMQGGESDIPRLDEIKAGIAATGLGLIGYTHAKEQLVTQGMDQNRVEKMAVGQVLAIYTERICRQFTDEYEKLWYLPFAEAKQASQALNAKLRNANFIHGSDADRELLPIVTLLMPAIQAVRSAQVRLERDVASLRVVEALRMYAADHDGKLPKTLDEITAVPIPPNPATGNSFEYRLDGTTAVLELPPSDGLNFSRRFEIQIAAKK
jgi:hypothetical protein